MTQGSRWHPQEPNWVPPVYTVLYMGLGLCISEISTKMRLASHTRSRFLGIPPIIFLFSIFVWLFWERNNNWRSQWSRENVKVFTTRVWGLGCRRSATSVTACTERWRSTTAVLRTASSPGPWLNVGKLSCWTDRKSRIWQKSLDNWNNSW